jgi:hypothetical protein
VTADPIRNKSGEGLRSKEEALPNPRMHPTVESGASLAFTCG